MCSSLNMWRAGLNIWWRCLRSTRPKHAALCATAEWSGNTLHSARAMSLFTEVVCHIHAAQNRRTSCSHLPLQANCCRQHRSVLLQGFAEDTDSSTISSAVSTAPEDDSSQPSGWQPSSNALPGLQALKHRTSLLMIHEVASVFKQGSMRCLVHALPAYLQVGLLMLRRRRPRCHQPWMVRSSSHQAARTKSKLKAAFSQKHGRQESLEAILQTSVSPRL